MTTEHNGEGLIGASIRRVEDPLLISGKGCYVDDINLPGMLHMMVLRSAYAHAKIISINTDAARSMKGVVAVVTVPDLPQHLNINAQLIFRVRRSHASGARARRRSRPGYTGRCSGRGEPGDCPGRVQRHRGRISSAAVDPERRGCAQAGRAPGS